MARLTRYISEKLIEEILDSDIEMLFEPVRKRAEKIHPALRAWDVEKFRKVAGSHRLKIVKVFTSAHLKSPVCQRAHGLKPVEIRVGVVGENSYNSVRGNIFLGLVAEYVGMSPERMKTFSLAERAMFAEEFNPVRIKSTIYHELTHWLDDALHNNHLEKRIAALKSKVMSMGTDSERREFLSKGKPWEEKYFEINAVVHQVAYIKRVDPVAWDAMSWRDLETLVSTIGTVFKKNPKARKMLIKRLEREKLIGKNMKPE
jgi:hypothetical protein